MPRYLDLLHTQVRTGAEGIMAYTEALKKKYHGLGSDNLARKIISRPLLRPGRPARSWSSLGPFLLLKGVMLPLELKNTFKIQGGRKTERI